jgi:hypothetical protein
MARPTEGCCGTCGYLSRRVKPTAPGAPRAHSIFAEVEPHERDRPNAEANIVPGEANAWMQGEFGCFAHVVNLPLELLEVAKAHPSDATERVVWKDRHCPRWSRYEPGVAPRDQLREAKARAFEEERQAFARKLAEFESRQVKRERRADRRLTVAAIWLASIIGLAQLIASLLTMSSDSVAYRWFSVVPHWCLWRLFH